MVANRCFLHMNRDVPSGFDWAISSSEIDLAERVIAPNDSNSSGIRNARAALPINRLCRCVPGPQLISGSNSKVGNDVSDTRPDKLHAVRLALAVS